MVSVLLVFALSSVSDNQFLLIYSEFCTQFSCHSTPLNQMVKMMISNGLLTGSCLPSSQLLISVPDSSLDSFLSTMFWSSLALSGCSTPNQEVPLLFTMNSLDLMPSTSIKLNRILRMLLRARLTRLRRLLELNELINEWQDKVIRLNNRFFYRRIA